MSVSSPPQRIAHLDGLRGLAALDVVLVHYMQAFLSTFTVSHPVPPWVLRALPFFLNGEAAVMIFFVLSGFVLAQSSAKTTIGLASTILARYLRLTVPMLTSLVLAWVLVDRFHDTRVAFQKVMHNAWLIDGYYTTQRPSLLKAIGDGIYGVYATGYSLFDGPTWTMRKELLGSLLVYLTYLVCPARYRWWAIAAAVLVTMAGMRYFLAFPLGMLLREGWVRGWLRPHRFSGLILLAGLICAESPLLISRTFPNLVALGAAGIVYSVMTLSSLRALLDRRTPQFLGEISFALYLVHVPLFPSVMAWGYLHVDVPATIKFWLGLAVFLTISTILAWLITVAVDEPLVQWLHRLKRRHPAKPV